MNGIVIPRCRCSLSISLLLFDVWRLCLGLSDESIKVVKVDAASPAGIEPQRLIARWTALRFEFLDVFVKAGLVRYMTTGKLEYSLPPERVFQRLFASSAGASYERSLPP